MGVGVEVGVGVGVVFGVGVGVVEVPVGVGVMLPVVVGAAYCFPPVVTTTSYSLSTFNSVVEVLISEKSVLKTLCIFSAIPKNPVL